MKQAVFFILIASIPIPGASQISPPSGIRVVVENARIDDLSCRSRGLKLESTAYTLNHFPYMTKTLFTADLDPQTLLTGIFGTILLVPVTIAAVPYDLLASPFRRRCEFVLGIDASLTEWAGGRVPGKSISVESRNETKPGVPGVAAAEIFNSTASARADQEGRFSLAVSGRSGRSGTTALFWRIDGREGSIMALSKRGGRFVLTEEDAGFGSGVFENEPREIIPTSAVRR